MSKTINKNVYDIKNPDEYEFKAKEGLTKEIVMEISRQKEEPKWVLDIRLKALEMYNKLALPVWGPDLDELNMDEIATYVRPKTSLKDSWEEVPENIKSTFEKLGIPKAERNYLHSF